MGLVQRTIAPALEFEMGAGDRKLQGVHYSLRLPNGLTVIAEEVPEVRSAAFQLVIPAGSVTDPDEMEGSASILEGLSYRGAGGKTAREFSDALDALGIQRAGGADVENVSFGAALLAEDLDPALELYADLVRRPHLPEEDLPAEQALAIQKLERLEDNPAEKLFVELRRAYFLSPHGRSGMGTVEGIRGLTRDRLIAEHARRYCPQGSILSVAGKFHWGKLSETVHRLFGDWSGTAPAIPAVECRREDTQVHVEHESHQTQIGLYYPTVPMEHPDFYNQRMAIAVLSHGMSARLFHELREVRGLCYSVRAWMVAYRGSASVAAYVASKPERAAESQELLVAEFLRLAEGISEEELSRARVGMLAALVMQGESVRARAQTNSRDQFLLGRIRSLDEIRNEVEQVTPDSICDFLHRQPPHHMTVMTLGTSTPLACAPAA